MRRRDLITVLGGAAVCTLAARAQGAKLKHIGVLWHAASAEQEAVVLNPLVERYSEAWLCGGTKRRF